MVTVAQQHQHQNQEDGSCYQNEKNLQEVIVGELRRKEDDDSPVAGSSKINALVPASNNVCVNSEEDGSQDGSSYCSDMDESVEGEDEGRNWNTVSPTNVVRHTSNGLELPPSLDDLPSFGDVCVKTSSNVHLGNKTSYNGPVTIKQHFVYTNPNLLGDSGTNYVPVVGTIHGDGNTSDVPGQKFAAPGGAPVHHKEEYKDLRGRSWILSWRSVALLCALASFLVATIVTSVVLLSGDRTASKFPELPDSSIDKDAIPYYDGVRFVKRNEWLAQPPTQKMDALEHPVPYVIISHTASDFCPTQSECTFRVRFIQTFHIESRGWSDIAYNFLVGGDGLCYIGRGWNFVGAHSYGFNSRSIGISFIGTFNSVTPSKSQLNAAKKIIKLGVESKYIASNYTLLGHRQVSPTLSPGDALYEVIKTWPRWSPNPAPANTSDRTD